MLKQYLKFIQVQQEKQQKCLIRSCSSDLTVDFEPNLHIILEFILLNLSMFFLARK